MKWFSSGDSSSPASSLTPDAMVDNLSPMLGLSKRREVGSHSFYQAMFLVFLRE